jgi:hypothetical protein
MTKYRSPRKRLEDALDKACREYVLLRDEKCILCGSIEVLHNSHYIRRGHHCVRWDLRNQNAMCQRCHFKHHHGYEYLYAEFMHRKYGDAIMDELARLANVPAYKWSLPELEEKLAEVERLTAELT